MFSYRTKRYIKYPVGYHVTEERAVGLGDGPPAVSQYCGLVCVVCCVRLVFKWDSSVSAVGTVVQLVVGSEELRYTLEGGREMLIC